MLIEILTSFFVVVGICSVILQLVKFFNRKKHANSRKVLLFINKENYEATEFMLRNTSELAEDSSIWVVDESENKDVMKICCIARNSGMPVHIISHPEKIKKVKELFS